MHKLSGMCFSIGRNPPPDMLSKALKAVAEDTDAIRTYSFEPYHREALQHGLKVVPESWIGSDDNVNKDCMDALICGATRFKSDLVITGHEVLMRRDLRPDQLIKCIEYVRRRVPSSTQVTTGEEATYLYRNPSVMAACDVIGMQYYPFTYGVHIDRAVQDFIRTYDMVCHAAKGKRVIVLETGWPSDDGSKGEAVASLENARRYLCELTAWSRTYNVEIYWFEAFNELFKAQLEAPYAAHWGIRHHEHMTRKYWHA